MRVVHVGREGAGLMAATAAAMVGGVGAFGLYQWRQNVLEREAADARARAEDAERRELQRQRDDKAIAEAVAAAARAAAMDLAALEVKQAQAALACEPVLSDLRTRIEVAAAVTRSSQESIEPLREALEAATLMVANSPLSETAADAANEWISVARARLAEMEKACRTRVAHEEARLALQEALLSRDSAACRSALEEIEQVREVLQALREEVPPDGGLVADAMAHVEDFERCEQEARRKAAALGALEDAVASRLPRNCEEALAEARAAGVAPCPASEMASLLAQNRPAYRALADQISSRIAADDICSGLSADDVALAEADAAATMDAEALCRRAAELARALVVNHQLLSRRVEAALPQAGAELSEACALRAAATLGNFKAEMKVGAEAKVQELHAAFEKRAEEAAAQARARVREMAEARTLALRAVGEEQRHQAVASAREALAERLGKLSEQLQAVGALEADTRGPHRLAGASRSLSRVLLGESCSLGGRGRAWSPVLASPLGNGDASAADAFASRLIASLPPEVARSTGEEGQSEALGRRFAVELPGLVSMAFTPPAAGLLGSLLAAALGRIFGAVFSLHGEKPGDVGQPTPPLGGRFCAATEEAEDILRRNLSALSRAAHLLERGKLEGALAEIERDLRGACREKAGAWMEEARRVLLLQQISRALWARARCLNDTME